MAVQWTLIGAGLGVVLAVLGAVLGWAVFPPLVDEGIAESVAIVEGTDQWDRFIETPIPLQFKVYFFNCTNPEEVQNGAKPILSEVGPFIYKQYRSKSNTTFSDDDTKVSYHQKQIYEFDREASQPLVEYDSITILNVALNAALQIVEDDVLSTGALNGGFNEVFNNPTDMFLRTTVRNFLFEGVSICTNPTGLPARAACQGIELLKSMTMRKPEKGKEKSESELLFSFFNHKNNTDDGVWEVSTGQDDVQLVGEIQAWNDKSTVDTWPGGSEATCNQINGTDTTIFPPHRTPEGYLEIFNPDICRSVTIHYKRKSEYKGIETYVYETDEDFLQEISAAANNECFCLNKTKGITREDGCLLKGALDLTNCQGAPIILTLPHFLGAAKEYQDSVIGLNPQAHIHKIFVEVEPYTGSPMRGGKRVQFNMFIRPVNGFKFTENLMTSLVPIAWVEEGTELTQELIDVMNESLFDKLVILEAVKWTLIAVGIVLACGLVGLYFFKRTK